MDITYALFLFIGIIGVIFTIRLWINEAIKKVDNLANITSSIFSIKNKISLGLIAITTITQDDDLVVLLTYPIYNHSLKTINGSVGKGTKWSIKIVSDGDQKIYTEENPTYPQSPPFLPFEQGRIINSHPIKIPFKDQMIIKITTDFRMNYNDGNNEVYLLEDKKEVCFQLNKQGNGLIKEQPVSIPD